MKTRLAIAVSGAVGLVTVLKTSLYYAGQDGLAFGLTLLMGAALIGGLIELWRLAGRVNALGVELSALRKDATAERLQKASAPLQALIRARLDRLPLPVPGPVFAPFVVGLLVMLGLLGTFLGLFETLRGASVALTTGSDVDALRAGLKTPMLGLMRSFGTSAAGVAASAMLGLATVFARRAGAELSLQLHEMTSGPLAGLSESRRQLGALESLSTVLAAALTAQERAVPDAADALQKAHETLAARTATIDAAIDRQLTSMQEAVDVLCGRLQQTETEAQARLSTLLSSMQESQQQHAARLTSVEQEVAKQLGETLATLGDQHAAQAQKFAGVEARLAEKLGDTLSSLEQGREQQAQKLARVEERLATRFGETLSSLGQGHEQQAQRFASIEERLAAKLGETLSAFDRGHEQQAQRLASVEERLTSQFGEALSALSHGHEQQAQRLASAEQRLAEQLSSAGQGLLQAESAVVEQWRTLSQRLEAFMQTQEERSQRWQASSLEQQSQQVQELSKRFGEHLIALQESQGQSMALIEEAASLVKGGGAELVTVAETFAAAVEQQRESLRQWLDSLGEIERSVTGAGEAAAADVLGEHLARTHEVFDRQLRFQQEVVEQLRESSKRDVAPEAGADVPV